MTSDWDEIRRLAADLQRAQLSGTVQRLSERNCIELVAKLIRDNHIELIYTSDGKEYLTPQHLQREIKDELYSSNGRASLVDLAQTLNVDFSHVENQAQTITKSDSRVWLVLGQLVDSTYIDLISEEINDRLQLEGTISFSTITKEYDLPPDFLQEQIETRLGNIIEGFRDEHDPKTILTPTYLLRNKAKVRGALSAITVPTPVANLVERMGIKEQLFFSLAEELIQTKRISGTISGGKRANKATYIPSIYSRAQTRWVDDFFAQNGYVEYDALRRMGISEPKSFLKKRFSDGEVTFLSSTCVGKQVVDSISSSVEDAILGNSWIDIGPLLPSVLTPEDGQLLLRNIVEPRSRTSSKSFHVFADTVLFTAAMLEKLEDSFTELIQQQAKDDIASKKYEKLLSQKAEKFEASEDTVDKKEERRKKAGTGKAGGGTQGRETKTKATKKKYNAKGRKNNADISDDDEHEVSHKGTGGGGKKGQPDKAEVKVEFMTLKALEEKLSTASSLEECPEELYLELSRELFPKLNGKFKAIVMDLYQSSILASTHDKRKSHGEMSEKVNATVSMIRLFEKGVACFQGSEREHLERYLLKTLCTEVTNAVFAFVQDEHGGSSPGSSVEFTADQRLKIMNQAPKSVGESLQAIHKALAKESVAAFLDCFESGAANAVDLFIKKSDKKKDRQLVFGHRQSLLEQLEKCQEPALALHLCVLIVFVVTKNAIIHASGKFVPQILAQVCEGSLAEESVALLKDYQDRVMKCFTTSEEEEKSALNDGLMADLAKVKDVAANIKKTAAKTE